MVEERFFLGFHVSTCIDNTDNGAAGHVLLLGENVASNEINGFSEKCESTVNRCFGVGLSLVTRTVSTIRGACTCTEVTELSVASCACATPPPRQSDSAAAAKAAAPGNTNMFFTRTPRVMCSLARMLLRNYFAFSLTYQ